MKINIKNIAKNMQTIIHPIFILKLINLKANL